MTQEQISLVQQSFTKVAPIADGAAVMVALLWTLKRGLGDAWTKEVGDVWTAA